MSSQQTQFLYPVAPRSEGPLGWWSQYDAALGAAGIEDLSRRVIDVDATYIVDRGVFGAGEPGSSWPEGRERSGVVMGAVQSGKTASMLAVIAKALDRGVDVAVLLAGTRRSLWLQTLERLLSQFDIEVDAGSRRLMLPNVASVMTPGLAPSDLYSAPRPLVKRTLAKGRPIVAVVMKNPAHIEQIAKTLHRSVYPVAKELGRTCHVLVIDDEADDSSIVDAVIEPDAGDYDRHQKQVPRRILDLWESRYRQGETVAGHVYATYIAYTATPQANFLQDPNNPLAPRDFALSLRTPGSSGQVEPRTPSYRVDSVGAMYTGGEVFYKTLASVPLCVDTDDYVESAGGKQTGGGQETDPVIVDAIRAYLVASAVRIWRDRRPLTPVSATNARFDTPAEARSKLPEPASMLVNPAAAMADHFAVASEIIAWSMGESQGSIDFSLLEDRRLRVPGVCKDMDSSPDDWLRWLARYRHAAGATVAKLGAAQTPLVPDDNEWGVLRSLILEEIVPATLVSVINSDPAADERPEYESVRVEDGAWRSPKNLSTIFVSGNVMSRGLTLEGLTTTAFTRRSATPLADTQMQMQRWFGYRGKYIELCRVFMSAKQREFFEHYHDNDEAMRRDVLGAMDTAIPGRAPAVTVLQGRDFKATGKFVNLRGVSLFPGATTFFPFTGDPSFAGRNVALLGELLTGDVLRIEERGAVSAAFSPRTWTMLQVADLLDSLQYQRHGDTQSREKHDKWASVGRIAGLQDAADNLYRGPVVEEDVYPSTASPYWVAAYLRFWDACLNRNVPGLYTFDEHPVRWNLIDFATRKSRAPRFRVGVRFGGGAVVADGPLGQIGFEVRAMQRARKPDMPHVLGGTWGSQNSLHSGRSDQFLDYRVGPGVQGVPEYRAPGEPGMVLFHLVGDPDGQLSVALGYGLPYGGPDLVEARTRP